MNGLQNLMGACVVALFLPAAVPAQSSQGPALGLPRDAYPALLPLPGGVDRVAKALGDRVSIAGREKAILTGTYTDSSGTSSPVTITRQSPNLIRTEFSGPSSAVAVFDGSQSYALKGRLGEGVFNVLEMWTLDTSEGFIDQLRHESSLRRLGDGFPLPGITGRSFTIYEMDGPIRTGGDGRRSIKHYWFDQVTGQLTRTQHFGSSEAEPAEATVVSGWATLDGQAVPTKMVGLLGTKVIHTFTMGAALLDFAILRGPISYRFSDLEGDSVVLRLYASPSAMRSSTTRRLRRVAENSGARPPRGLARKSDARQIPLHRGDIPIIHAARTLRAPGYPTDTSSFGRECKRAAPFYNYERKLTPLRRHGYLLTSVSR